jgi:DNA modification methylase
MPTNVRSAARAARPQLAFKTERGTLFVGETMNLLDSPTFRKLQGKVQLVFTSPPFPLARKKRYGNLVGDDFSKWLAEFAEPLKKLLTPTGSIVMELGNGWVQGSPVMSTASIKALLAFQEAADLHLCQEFICFNPARLPTPAQWVTIERVRVKDSFTRVWWMSPTPNPKADNRKVLTEYSDSMRRLLQKGTYTGGLRPSEHRIGEKSFLQNNGGAIPSNVLVPPHSDRAELTAVLPISNTSSRDPYQQRCKDQNLVAHPARMPEALAAFFVQFLTDEDDLVLDPFAGSNTTGFVAEKLNRNWIGIELSAAYAESAKVRFDLPAKAA